MVTRPKSLTPAAVPSPGPLATKLQPPPIRPRLVARPRLLTLLSTDPLPKVTLVDAPPGWGKTTLVTEWIARDVADRRFAWLSLDREDNDPARFWTYVVEALRTAEPQLGGAALTSLRVPGANVVEVVLPNLINELADVFTRLNIPFKGTLGIRAKAEYRADRTPYQSVFTPEQRQLVQRIFAREIELHGYRF